MKIFHSVPFEGVQFEPPNLTIGGKNPLLKFDEYNQYFVFTNRMLYRYDYVHIKSPRTSTFKSFKFLERKKVHELEKNRFGGINTISYYRESIVDYFSDLDENSFWLFLLIR